MTYTNKPIFEEPTFLQVKNHLLNRITTNQFLPGQKLPHTRLLAQEYGTGRGVILKVLNMLSRSGHVVSYQRKGVFVAAAEEKSRSNKKTPDKQTSYKINELEPGHKKAFSRGIVVRLEQYKLYTSPMLDELFLGACAKIFKERTQGSPGSATRELAAKLAGSLAKYQQMHLKSSNICLIRGEAIAIRNIFDSLKQPAKRYIIVRNSNNKILLMEAKKAGYNIECIAEADYSEFLSKLERFCIRQGDALAAVYLETRSDRRFGDAFPDCHRDAFLELARRHKFAIIEADFERELAVTPFLPLFSRDPCAVIYLTAVCRACDSLYPLSIIAGASNFISCLRLRSKSIEDECYMRAASICFNSVEKEGLKMRQRLIDLRKRLEKELSNRVNVPIFFTGVGAGVVMRLPANTSFKALRVELMDTTVSLLHLNTEWTGGQSFKLLKFCFARTQPEHLAEVVEKIVSIVNTITPISHGK